MIGEAVERLEDERFLTGRARYVADLAMAGMAHAVILRSPHAHARIRGIDPAAALAAEGVVAVLTAKDVPPAVEPIPMRIPTHGDLEPFLQPVIASGRVRYVGEPVAVVVAESRALAEDAAELVEIDFEPLPTLVDPEKALSADAEPIHEVGNLVARWTTSVGDVDAAMAAADRVIEGRFETQRHTAAPLETRGLLAAEDPARGLLEVYGATKVPHVNRAILARMLDRAETSIRMVEVDVGGSFGVRGEFYPEDFLVPFAALRLGRPVRWIEDRLEHFAAINHSREQRWDLRVAFRTNGEILGLDARLLNDMGAYVRTHGTVVASHSTAFFPGPYRIASYRAEATCAATNRTPTATLRAPGMFEANFVRERAIDMIAAELGIAADEVRRRNLIGPGEMPYDVGTVSVGRPTIYDSGDFPALFERALERFGWTEKVTEGENGRRRAMGLAAIVEPSGLGPFEGAGVAIDASGRVEIRTGATSQGQGQETTLAQVAASVLGVDLDRIRVRHGDTALIPFGSGTYASRAAIMAGNAVRLASQAVRDAALETAATLLQTDASSLRLEGGAAVVADDPARSVSLGDIARALAPGSTLLKASPADAQFEDAAGLAATRYVRAVPAGAAVFAVHLAEVAVDPATGEIAVTRALVAADVGRAINPAIVEGQLVGGFLQGLGGTLLEELAYDDAGQLITATFADYPLPGAWEAPAIEVLIVEASPAPGNGLGVKGVGEIGTSGAGAAIANAVARALGEPGRRLTSLPLTPDRVLGLLAGMPETVP